MRDLGGCCAATSSRFRASPLQGEADACGSVWMVRASGCRLSSSSVDVRKKTSGLATQTCVLYTGGTTGRPSGALWVTSPPIGGCHLPSNRKLSIAKYVQDRRVCFTTSVVSGCAGWFSSELVSRMYDSAG